MLFFVVRRILVRLFLHQSNYYGSRCIFSFLDFEESVRVIDELLASGAKVKVLANRALVTGSYQRIHSAAVTDTLVNGRGIIELKVFKQIFDNFESALAFFVNLCFDNMIEASDDTFGWEFSLFLVKLCWLWNLLLHFFEVIDK